MVEGKNKDSENENTETTYPKTLLIIPINNPPIFPGMMAPLVISKKMFTANLEAVVRENGLVCIMLAKNNEDQKITSQDLYRYGTVAKVLKRVNLPDGDVNILVHSQKRLKVKKYFEQGDDLFADVQYLDDIVEKGLEQGLERGIEKEKYTIAKLLLSEGADISFVSKITRLSVEELRRFTPFAVD